MSDSQDEELKVILRDDFDPVQYLNGTLPNLNLTSQASSAKQNRTGQLQSSSADLQGHIAKVNAYNARTSAELTSLTDEILRSGNRLAYEVEVLRSDANSLFDLLSDTLREDIQHFVKQESNTNAATSGEVDAQSNGGETNTNGPGFMEQLRLLSHVKARLEEVVRVFGDALKWPIPPSDVSVASSLISVSAPELGVVNTAEDDQARATIRQYRDEISDLLNSEGGGPAGLEAANRRLEDFQRLALVWKGTAEERARNRVVDGFARIVEDRRKTLGSQSQYRRPQMDSTRSSAQASRSGTPSLPAGGLLGGLRKLRDEIYLD